MSSQTSVLPRKGSVMYSFMKETTQNQSKTANRFKLINKFLVVPLYRLYILPLFLIGRIILLVYAKGRKSGKRRINPLEFRRYSDKTILLFSARGKYSDWYKNILANPEDVVIKIGFRKYRPSVQKATTDEKFEMLSWYMKSYPKSAKSLFGYNKKDDAISNDLIQPLVDFLEILKLTV